MAEIMLEQFGQIARSTKQHPVDFDRAWQWIGYSRKDYALGILKANFEEGMDFDSRKNWNQTGGRGGDRKSVYYFLSVDCFKSFCMMAGTDKGREVRKYYLQIEKKYFESRPGELKALRESLMLAKSERDTYKRLWLEERKTVLRFENRNFLTWEDKREIIALLINRYPLSRIQRITKKSYSRIKSFRDEFINMNDEEFEEFLVAIKSGGVIRQIKTGLANTDDEPSESFGGPLVDASREMGAGQ